MKKITRQLLAGITIGAVVLTGGIAAVASAADQGNAPRQGVRQMREVNREEFAAKVAEDFGVKKDEVMKAINNNTDIRDIGHAAMLAKLSGKSFSGVLAMKSDWRDVEKKLGISQEAIAKEQNHHRARRIAERGGLDSTVVEKLMSEGYAPMDIEIAGRIAKASGKDINTVLAARKINNKWSDVAKEFGLSEQNTPQLRRGSDGVKSGKPDQFRRGEPGDHRFDGDKHHSYDDGDHDDHDHDHDDDHDD